MLSVTLRQIEYIVAIERFGGMSAAADALFTSQPALSVALKQVEAQLGKSLFLRQAGGPMVLTSFGRGFLPHARALIDDAARLMMRDAVRVEPVALTIFADLAPLLLAPILTAVKAVLPEVEILTHIAELEAVAHSFGAIGTADLAVSYDLGLDDTLVRREIMRLPLRVVVAAEHPFARDGTATMAEVAGEPIVMTDQGLSRAHMLRVFTTRGLGLSVVHMAGTTETMRSFAANGLGVGLSYTAPRTDRSYDGKPVRHVIIADANASEPVVLVHPRADALSPTAEAVGEIIAGMDPPLDL